LRKRACAEIAALFFCLFLVSVFHSSHSYGADAATMWIARWRGFYLACAESFDYNSGNEWFVSHYLFRKRC
jgi:hypothetical protein